MKNARPSGRAFALVDESGGGVYWPPPKRRDHQPALRGAAGAASGAGSVAVGSVVTASGAAAATVGVLSATLTETTALSGLSSVDWGSVNKLTFSRTVERRGVFSGSAFAGSAGCVS